MENNFNKLVKEKTDNELLDIYMNSKDYQVEFVNFVTEEITHRNLSIDTLDEIRSKKVEENDNLLVLGRKGNSAYLVLIAISALLGGLIGIIGGYIYAYSTVVDSQGNKLYVYDESTRKWGRIILGVGVVMLFLILVSKFN
jgi:hypothetical protein